MIRQLKLVRKVQQLQFASLNRFCSFSQWTDEGRNEDYAYRASWTKMAIAV